MHSMFADWYAKADREPSQEKLQSRSAGVEAFASEASLAVLLDLLRYVDERGGSESDPAMLQEKLKQEDPTFLLRDNDVEVRVLAAISLILAINRDSQTSAGVALAVDVASALGTVEVGPLGQDLVESAQAYLIEKGRRLRIEPEIVVAKKFTQPTLDAGELSLPQKGVDVAQLQENATALANYATQLNTAIKAVGAPLRALAATLDALAAATSFNTALAEESSMLWWLVGEHSRDLEVHLGTLKVPSVCVVAGKDLADLTRIIPGPLSVRAILHKALDAVGADPASQVELGQLVDETDRGLRQKWFRGLDIKGLRGLGHCLPALAASVEVDGDWRELTEKRDGISPGTHRSQIDWARLCYSESLLLRQLKDQDD
jgi:GTPase-associated system helical domain